MRKHLSAPNLYEIVRAGFNELEDKRRAQSISYSMTDVLMSAMAMFFFKSSSMLGFDKNIKIDPKMAENIQNIFKIKKIPSDTTMREVIDEIPTDSFRAIYKKIFSVVQRGNGLKEFEYMGQYIMPLDGTGIYSSGTLECPGCCVKNHKNDEKTFYHQALAGVLVHPFKSNVLVFPPEPITKQDGTNKNDCERNATFRFIKEFRREHPHLQVTVTADSLASKEPTIRELERLEFNYVLGCKPGDHKTLFDIVELNERNNFVQKYECKEGKFIYKFKFINNVQLNNSSEKKINFLDFEEVSESGKIKHFSWVTNFKINNSNVYQLMRIGRSKWKIENETFNTLKNQGYNLEHNYGHGKKNLSNNLMVLMFLVFFIDQVLLNFCEVYQQARKRHLTFHMLWEHLRSTTYILTINSLEDLIKIAAYGITATFTINTS